MPETQNFYASGKGNGFPFCLDSAGQVIVAGDDYWTTLSGYNKTHADAGISVTQEQIFASLANAAKLFWNTYGVTGTASAAFTHNGPNSYSGSIANVSIDDQDDRPDAFDPVPVPKERVCSSPALLAEKRDIASGELAIAMMPYLNRLYNGWPADEGSFVGYGMRIATVNADTFSGICNVSLSHSGSDISPFWDYADQSIGYVELYGMHFVANCWAISDFFRDDGIEANITSSTSLSPLSASITLNSLLDQSLQSNASAEITSLDFYTYT